MPAMFGKDAKKAELIQNLGEEFKKGICAFCCSCFNCCLFAVMRLYRIPPGDFPEIERMKLHLNDYDFKNFPKLDLKMMEKLEQASFQKELFEES